MSKSLISEKSICNSIVEYLNYQGAYCWRTNAGAVRATNKYGQTHMIKIGRAGTSDIIGVYKGRFLAIEVKKTTTRKRVTEAQNEFLQTIRDKGGIAFVATSPEEAKQLLVETLKENV